LAQQVDARIHALELPQHVNDVSVTVHGPDKTLSGAQTPLGVEIYGDIDIVQRLVVSIDGQTIIDTTDITDYYSIPQTWFYEGSHQIVATITAQDQVRSNNAFYKTIRVVPKAPVLYLGNDALVERTLQQIFSVDKVSRIPQQLDDYTALIAHNVPAS